MLAISALSADKKTLSVFSALQNTSKWKLTATLCASKFMSELQLQLQNSQQRRSKGRPEMNQSKPKLHHWRMIKQTQKRCLDGKYNTTRAKTQNWSTKQIMMQNDGESQNERQRRTQRAAVLTAGQQNWCLSEIKLNICPNMRRRASQEEERDTHTHADSQHHGCLRNTLIKECHCTAETFNCSKWVYNTHTRTHPTRTHAQLLLSIVKPLHCRVVSPSAC